MSGPRLIEQLMQDAKLSKADAQRVSMLSDFAEAKRPLAAAARALGITEDHARHIAPRFQIVFAQTVGERS